MASDDRVFETLFHSRIRGMRIVFLAVFTLVAARLFMVQVLDHGYWSEKAKEVANHKIPLPSQRGAILDSSGRELAVDRPAFSAYVHPDKLNDVPRTARELGEALGLDPEKLQAEIEGCTEAFMYVKRGVDMGAEEALLATAEREPEGFGTLPERRRVYPKESLAADLLGFVGTEHEGLEGLEARMEERLRGTDGVASGEVDGFGWPITHRTQVLQPARDGETIVLTIDADIQQACERELAEGVKEHGAQGGCVIVMHAPSGRVMAACDYPSFNPNHWQSTPPDVWRPRFSTWTYEPGSTIKPFVVATALAEGDIRADERFLCEGKTDVPDYTIECRHGPPGGHGWLTAAEVLKYSCNIGALRIGQRLGTQRLADLFRQLGFTQSPTDDIFAQYQDLTRDLNPTWCATASYGQGIGITPLHLTAAYGALANDGVLMKPQFIKAIIGPDQRTSDRPPERVRRVLSEDAARLVCSYLTDVVQSEGGTGSHARLPGSVFAGKTGTAEIPRPRGYYEDQYIVSFVGMFPGDDPEWVITVVVDRPAPDNAWGGTVAAPIFRDIAESLITALGVPVADESAPGAERTHE